MTFDVSELPRRAAALREEGVRAGYREMTRYGGGGDEFLDAAEERMAGVESIYDDFLDMPDPQDFAAACSDLATGMHFLLAEAQTRDPITGAPSLFGHNPNLTLIGSGGDLLASWTGEAAYAYKNKYADQFISTATAQHAAMSVLLNAINAEAAVWSALRDDLDQLSSQAIEMMKQAGNKGGAEWIAVLTVAAAVVAIPVTGGMSAAAIPAVAAGLTVAATGIGLPLSGPEDPKPQSIRAGSSDEVIEGLRNALDVVKSLVRDAEYKITHNMSLALSHLDENASTFCLSRPALADAPHHPVNDPTMGGFDA